MPTKNDKFRFDFSVDFSKLFFTTPEAFKKTFTVSRILKSGPYTHVFWADRTKTSVRRAPDEDDSDYAAFTAALAIKLYGSNSALKRMLREKTEVQQPKKKKSTGCTDTCPIDLDRIERELALANSAKTESEASEHIANAIIGNVT